MTLSARKHTKFEHIHSISVFLPYRVYTPIYNEIEAIRFGAFHPCHYGSVQALDFCFFVFILRTPTFPSRFSMLACCIGECPKHFFSLEKHKRHKRCVQNRTRRRLFSFPCCVFFSSLQKNITRNYVYFPFSSVMEKNLNSLHVDFHLLFAHKIWHERGRDSIILFY